MAVFSSHFVPFLRQRLGLGLDREDAVEFYYNAALTGWTQATLDLQVIDPALSKRLAPSGRRLEDAETTVIPEVRVFMRF